MPAIENREIGKRLVNLRKAVDPNLKQHEWAEKNGFGQTQYNNWERGLRRISIDSAALLCDRYGLTLDYIYFGRQDAISIYARAYT